MKRRPESSGPFLSPCGETNAYLRCLHPGITTDFYYCCNPSIATPITTQNRTITILVGSGDLTRVRTLRIRSSVGELASTLVRE